MTGRVSQWAVYAATISALRRDHEFTLPVAVRIDHDGRWVVHREKGDKDLVEKLAGAAIVIYVQKVLR